MSARETSAEPRRASLSPGQEVADRYRVDAVLGEGASGVVYLARREGEGEGERLALKVIHRHLCGDRQIYRRFHREASILKRLDGPHLVRLLDFVEHDGLLMIALEYVEGTSLEALLEREAPLDPGRAVEIGLQICAALEAAHAAGVVHRDLKPGNVLLQAAPSDTVGAEGAEPAPPRIKVVDFGLAKVVHGEHMTTGLTEQDMIFGTPEYMAPEQVQGEEADMRCDIYALGCILYEMTVGKPPFPRRTAIAAMTAHLSEQVAPPRAARADGAVSSALEAVILRALAKRPDDRYPSARAFAEALAACRIEGRLVLPDAVSITDLDLRRSALDALEHSPTIPSDPPSDTPTPPPPEGREPGLTRTLPVRSAPPGMKPVRRPAPDVKVAEPPRKPATARRLSDGALWVLIAVVFATIGIAIGTLVGRR
jgi:serine/threonine-protein kinase